MVLVVLGQSGRTGGGVGGSGMGMANDTQALDDLNANISLDLSNTLEHHLAFNEQNDDLIKLNSIFYDIDSFTGRFKNILYPLFISLNVPSLMSKHLELCNFLSLVTEQGVNIEVIALQEIWSVPCVNLINIPGYTFVFKERKSTRGGGVGFYIKNVLKFKIVEITPFVEKNFECLTVELSLPQNQTFILSNIYRSPTQANELTQNFTATLEQHLIDISRRGKKTFVFLDSNIDLLKLNENNSTSNYLNSILSSGFNQVIGKATRIQGNSFSLIDHILVNTLSTDSISGTLISDISDHFITFFCQPDQISNNTPAPKTSRKITDTKIASFNELLNGMGWGTVLASNNANDSFDIFWDTFKTLFDLHFPVSQTKFNKNFHKINAFMTNGLLTSRRQKNFLHKKMVADPSPLNKTNFKTYRNTFNSLIRISKKMYYDEALEKNAKNPKKTWSILKEVAFGNAIKEGTPEIVVNDMAVTDPKLIAENFNSFFTNVGLEIFNSVPPVDRLPESYQTPKNNVPDLDLGETGPIHVHEIIQTLLSKTSTDIDGISTKLIKKISRSIAVPLAHIFNLSLSTGIFPDALKTSRTIPIFKSGDKLNMDNYRPISLIKTFSKILEKMVALKLSNHLDINKLLHQHQYGFQAKKSTEHHLIHVTNKIGSALNNGEFCIGIFLDFKKAFDTVSHSILLKKLKAFGINGTSYKWFTSYLSDRKQQVDVNGVLSSSKNVDISILQGSILGPILFLCFINDLPNSTLLSAFLFADDTAVLAKNFNLRELVTQVNTELQNIANWLRANRMAINVSKTKFILFHTRGKHIEEDDLKVVFNMNKLGKDEDPNLIFPLERIHSKHPKPGLRSYKLLGIHFDEFLNFEQHVGFLCTKLSKILYCLRRASNVLTEKSLGLLYVAFINSNLLYCSNIVACASKTNLKKLTIIQKKAIRIVTKSKYNDHTAPLFSKTNMLTYENIQKFNKLSFMHSIEYQYAPASFNGTWNKNLNRDNNYNLRNVDDYILPPVRIELIRHIPVYSFALAWNELDDIKFQFNRKTFQQNLKESLLNSQT